MVGAEPVILFEEGGDGLLEPGGAPRVVDVGEEAGDGLLVVARSERLDEACELGADACCEGAGVA